MSYEEIYDDWSDAYVRMYPSADHVVEETKNSIGRFLQKQLPSGRVLEVGCGIGLVSAGLCELGYDVTGIDISGDSLKKAEKFSASRRLPVNFKKADLFSFDSAKKFDAVVAVASLIGHFEKKKVQEQALRRMAGLLRPGGIILIGVHDYERLLREEPDHSVEPVSWVRHQEGFTLYFRTREWHGTPRSRIHKTTYYLILDGNRMVFYPMVSRAITRREIVEVVASAGFADLRWLMPDMTGYYQPIFMAQKSSKTIKLKDDSSLKKLVVARTSSQPSSSRRILVMWSGNLDSTYVLLSVLKQTIGNIHVHHIRMGKDQQKNNKIENKTSIQELRNWIESHYGDFQYTENAIDASAFREQAERRLQAVYCGAQAAMALDFERNEDVLFGLSMEELDDWGPDTAGHWRAAHLFKAIWRSEEGPQYRVLVPAVTRAQEMSAIPKKLAKMLEYRATDVNDPVA